MLLLAYCDIQFVHPSGGLRFYAIIVLTLSLSYCYLMTLGFSKNILFHEQHDTLA